MALQHWLNLRPNQATTYYFAQIDHEPLAKTKI